MTTETKCLRGECNTPSSCRAHSECLALDPPEDSREVGSLYAGAPSIEPETETVGDVVAWMLSDASAGEDFFPSEIHTFAQRIAAAHAREVGELQDQLRQLKCDTLNFISLFTSGNSIFIDIHHVAKLHGRDIARDATALRDKINGTSGAITREIIT